jgi:hypothetical protein
MRSFDALPACPLGEAGALSRRFRALGLGDFRAAARHVAALPYGRVSDPADPTLVLGEGRGTCSTKHALLAGLAREQGLEVRLVLGVYEMSEANTPGVGAVLARHGLAALPEAHCYLAWDGERVDVTREVAGAEPIREFLHEETIEPAQIGDYKRALHRRVLAAWRERTAEGRTRTLEDLWRIREACIAALADGAGA